MIVARRIRGVALEGPYFYYIFYLFFYNHSTNLLLYYSGVIFFSHHSIGMMYRVKRPVFVVARRIHSVTLEGPVVNHARDPACGLGFRV